MAVAFQKSSLVLPQEEAGRELWVGKVSLNLEFRGQSLSGSLELAPGERWFVARALAHQETRAQFNLQRLGFRSFVPRLRRTVRHARQTRDVLHPLFPGYIFVVIDLSKQ